MNLSCGVIYYVLFFLVFWWLERKEESFFLIFDILLLFLLKKMFLVIKIFIMYLVYFDFIFNSMGLKNCIILFVLWIVYSNVRVFKEWIVSGKGVSCNCL